MRISNPPRRKSKPGYGSKQFRLDDNRVIATDYEADRVFVLNSGIVEPHCIFGVTR
jgi:hypothetical protein